MLAHPTGLPDAVIVQRPRGPVTVAPGRKAVERWWRAAGTGGRGGVRLTVVVVGLVLGAATEAATFGWGEPLRALPDLAVGVCFLGCGVVTWRSSRGAGTLFGATAAAWFLGTLWQPAVVLHRGPLAHLLFSYPGWRPRRRAEWAAVTIGYLAASAPAVWATAGGTLLLCVAGVCALGARALAAHGLTRRTRVVALRWGAVVAAALGGGVVVRDGPWVEMPDVGVLIVYQGSLVAASIALVAQLRGTREHVADVVVELGEQRSVDVRDALALALGDSSLQLGYWVPATGRYEDRTGAEVRIPAPGTGRVATHVNTGTGTHVRLVHDGQALRDHAVHQGVSTAVELAAANAELHQQLRARLDDVAASRRRLVTAADDEARRLQVRLSGGARQRLERLQSALAALPPPGAPQATVDLGLVTEHLQRTVADLDALAAGMHPPDLEEGLAGALEHLAARFPLPVRVRVMVADALPPEVQVAAYFVCAEALANVVKHARASMASVDVTEDDSAVTVAVWDDGCGGADLAAGRGLQGLADRAEALDGRLTVTSPPAGGTRLVAVLPYGRGALARRAARTRPRRV